MTTIEVDFEVYKALTAKRATESVTYNDVLRELLGLSKSAPPSSQPAKGATFKGVLFPEGTQFQAPYKGRTYSAQIKGGVWIDSDGTPRKSPSEAAVKITGKNWNGWRFWHCKRPGEPSFQLIDKLRPRPTIDDLML